MLTPTLSRINGTHTLKFGADCRDLQNNYYQAPGGGTFTFDNLITSQNALSPGASGNGLASILLGYGSGGRNGFLRASLAISELPGIFRAGYLAGHEQTDHNLRRALGNPRCVQGAVQPRRLLQPARSQSRAYGGIT